MIVTPRAAKVSAQAATKPHAPTKSGLQTHPLISKMPAEGTMFDISKK
jgi:hypothetical protein